MERVKKGEKYWIINSFFETAFRFDFYTDADNKNFEVGNYFNTKEEAEAMACKLRAVLKGADVIEMPSEEEIDDEIVLSYPILMGNYDAYKEGWKRSIEWLKLKIIK